MRYCLKILILFAFISCNIDEESKGIISVDLESCLDINQEIYLSDIVDTIEYIELKTPRDIVISRIQNIIPGDDFLIIHSWGGIFKFTKEGDFIKRIGRKGQGPDEYINILGIDIDDVRKEIIQADSQSILFYDYDGNFIRKTSISSFFFNIALCDSALWTCNVGTFLDPYVATALSIDGDTLARLPNPAYQNTINPPGFFIADLYNFREISKYKDHLYFHTRTSRDTVYQVSGSTYKPYLYLDMGKYQVPISHERWYSEKAYEHEGEKYWRVSRMDQDDHYLYFTIARYKLINEDRRHPDNVKYVIYDKKRKCGYTTKGESGVKITDDILGGPNFWPRWTTPNYYINTIEYYDLNQYIEDNFSKLSPLLMSRFNNWNEDTNELVILCKIKNKK